MRLQLFLIPVLLICCVSGCARWNTNHRKLNYRTVDTGTLRDTETARHKHQKALHLMTKCKYGEAEQKLHEALLADSSYGPAHNTLGKLYFDQRKFYLAAWEFEYAIRTMPRRPEAYNNLGLVYESVQQIDSAIMQYEQAAALSPENSEYLGNLVRARVRRGDQSFDVRQQLEILLTLETRPRWAQWASEQLAVGKLENPMELLPGEYLPNEASEFELIDSPEGDAWETIPSEPTPAIEPPLAPNRGTNQLPPPPTTTRRNSVNQ